MATICNNEKIEADVLEAFEKNSRINVIILMDQAYKKKIVEHEMKTLTSKELADKEEENAQHLMKDTLQVLEQSKLNLIKEGPTDKNLKWTHISFGDFCCICASNVTLPIVQNLTLVRQVKLVELDKPTQITE